MAASPVFGSPQFLNVRSTTPSTAAVPYYDDATNGLYNVTPYSASVAASHIVTAGPCTVGPIYVGINGTMWVLPFNSPISVPDFVIKALDTSVWTWL